MADTPLALEAPEQEPVQNDPPDAATKRANFLKKFAQLDPDAELDEKQLDGILANKEQRNELAAYVQKLNPEFQLTGDELADELKKKAPTISGNASATGSSETGTAPADLAQGQVVPGQQPADQPFQQVPDPELTPGGLSMAGVLEPVQYPESSPALSPLSAMGQEEVPVDLAENTALDTGQLSATQGQVYTPGDEYAAAGLPQPSREDLQATEAQRNQRRMAGLMQLPGGARPVLQTDGGGKPLFASYGDLPELPDGEERVQVPADYAGELPTDVKFYRIPQSTDPKAIYFNRPLSDEVEGEGKQSLGMAAARNFNNLINDGARGILEGAESIGQLATSGIRGVTQPEGRGIFGDAADWLRDNKYTAPKIAPLYSDPNRSFLAHPNVKNLVMSSSDVAGMAVPIVAQALAPEAGAGALLAKVSGTGMGLVFDGQILQGSHDRAVAAGMTPNQAALYTVLDGGLSIALFKGGGALLGKLEGKLTPEYVKGEILKEQTRILANRPVGAAALTQAELQQLMERATKAATPRLLSMAREGVKMGALFGANEAKTILTEDVARRTIGAKFTQATLGEALRRIGGAVGEGTLIGASSGGFVKKPAREPAGLVEAAPLEAPAAPTLFNVVRETGQVELRDVQVVGQPDAKGNVLVRGVDAQGKPVQREVPGGRLYPAREQAAPASESAANTPAQATDPQLVDVTDTAPEPIPAASEAPPEAATPAIQPEAAIVAPQQPAPVPAPRATPQYATVSPQGELGSLSAGPARPDLYQLVVTPDPNNPEKATFSYNADSNAETTTAYLLPGLRQYFDSNVTVNRPRAIEGRAEGEMELRDGQWVVTKKGRVFLNDGTPERTQATQVNNAQNLPASPAEPQPSPTEPATPAASPSPEPAAEPAPVERLPDAQPHPDHVTPLTTKQQAQNDALDALDRYNALKPGERKQKKGSAARAEVARAFAKAGLDIKLNADLSFTLGKRLTRANEYTATTPAASHVPLAERPAEVRDFTEKVLAATDRGISTIQGLGIKVRGKELSARELRGAVEDVRAGRNTLRAQLLLDALENATRTGYVEKSEGAGLATRKYQVPVDEFVGDVQPATARQAVPLADAELDAIYEQDAKARQAVADYANRDGTIDYAKLAEDERALPFLFEVSDETATKLAALARERATNLSQPQQPTPQGVGQRNSVQPTEPAGASGADTGGRDVNTAGAEPGSPPQGTARPDGVAPAGEQVASPTLAEQNAQARQEFTDALAEFRAARKRGSGTAQSSLLGIPAFSPEEAAALTKMARAAVKLGAVKVKQVIARLRAQGLTEDDATDDQLRPFVKQLLTDEGVRQPKPTRAEGAPLPANEPEGSATRKSMARLDADETQPEALRQRVRDTGLDKYEPKSLAETEKAVDDYMQRNSLADAYAEAISTSDNLTGDVRTALRARVLKAIGSQLSAATERGDTAAADEYNDQAYKVAEALAKRGTEAGREINAYKVLTTLSPEAIVYQTQKQVQAQREKQEAKLAKKAATEAKSVRAAKREALNNALATPAVRAAREKLTGKQPATTQERRAAIRAERADLFSQLRKLTGNLGIVSPQQQIAELHVKIFKSYLQEAALTVQALVERFKREAGPAGLKGVTDQQLRQRAAAAKGDHDEAIRQGTAALGKTLDQIARDRLSDPAAVGKTLAQQFVEGAGLNPAEAKTYADAIEAEFARRIARARQSRLDELARRATQADEPTKRKPSPTDLDKTRELFALSPTDDAAILDHLKRVNDLPELSAQDVAELRKLAGKIQDVPDGFQKDEAVENLLKRIAGIKGIKWADVGSAVWYADVLSGYKTHAINLTANLIQSGHELGISTLYGLGRGRYATAPAKGIIKGLGRGGREAASVLRTGRETSRTPDKYEVPGILEYVRFAGGAANPFNYLKYVNRALRAGDVLFSSGLREMRAYEQAVKFALEDAKSDGDPTPDIWARAAEKLYNTKERLADARAQAESEGLKGNDLQRRIYEIAEQSRDAKMTEDARQYGTRAVFNGEVEGGLGWVATGVQRITEGANWGGFKPGKYVVPFTRVITNVANAYLDYTPVGAARAIKGSTLLGGNAESKLQRQFTPEERWKLGIKAVIGSSVAAAAYALSNNKDENGQPTFELTGFGTGNPARDAQLRADGWQPYSIKIGGTWYSYANTPEAIMLAGVGSYNDGVKYGGEKADDQSALDKLTYNTFRALQFTKDMTALKGASDFLSAVDSRNPGQITQWAQRLGAGSVKGYVPFSGLLTQVEKDYQALTEQPKKQARSFGQMLVQDVPVARNSLNNALDVLGDPLPVDTDRLFSSAPHRDEPTQRIWDWLNKNELFISVPNRDSGGALVLRAHEGKEDRMTDDEYYEFMRNRGDIIKTLLLKDIDKFEKLNAKSAKLVLEEISEAATERAKVKTFFPNGLSGR